jgi:hypothetical protein
VGRSWPYGALLDIVDNNDRSAWLAAVEPEVRCRVHGQLRVLVWARDPLAHAGASVSQPQLRWIWSSRKR